MMVAKIPKHKGMQKKTETAERSLDDWLYLLCWAVIGGVVLYLLVKVFASL